MYESGAFMNRFTQVLVKNIPNMIAYYPKMRAMAKNPERYTEDEKYAFAMQLVNIVAKSADIHVDAVGVENIPKDGGCLICPNHQDKFDPLAIWMTSPRNLGVVLDDAACHRPFIGEFVNIVESYRLDRSDLKSMRSMTDGIAKNLENGKSFIIFPEGRYEKDYGKLLPFMAGCFRSSINSKTPIVPTAIIDSYHAFSESSPPPVKITVRYLKPIMPDEFEGLKTKELSEIVRKRIQDALDTYQK